MIRKPTSGDSQQRDHEAERARKSSQLSAGGGNQAQPPIEEPVAPSHGPMHGSAKGESAHGAIPRKGIETEPGDD